MVILGGFTSPSSKIMFVFNQKASQKAFFLAALKGQAFHRFVLFVKYISMKPVTNGLDQTSELFSIVELFTSQHLGILSLMSLLATASSHLAPC